MLSPDWFHNPITNDSARQTNIGSDMYFSKKLLSLICLGLISLSVMTPLTVEAKQVRSKSAKNSFKASRPCPSNGNRRGSCPGFIIDHIIALVCGGADAP